MDISLLPVLEKREISQQHHQWYVLDNEFSWNLKSVFQALYKHLDTFIDIPVIFCSILEANKIISELGDEEDEYLRFASGIYWRELGIIFIFKFDQFLPLMETLFHEFRHVMQDLDPGFRHHFETDKKLPYKERLTEIDAFQFAKNKMNEYLASGIHAYLVS
nr:DUF3920 family protein [uncultured Bacillus sp.]